MSRVVRIAAAQSGPVSRDASREETLDRLISLMRQAASEQADLIVFTECALTPFFSHWWIDDESELDPYYEPAGPGGSTQALFDEAERLKIGFHLGFAEVVEDESGKHRYNSSVLVDAEGNVIGRFRKVHLPGHSDHRPGNPFQN